jgi:aminoglycoside/choline kinase family phosphotransferase
MIDRDSILDSFLQDSIWSNWKRTHLAGDASNRKYERLIDQDTGATVVLMDSPGNPDDAVVPFVALTDYLAGIGLSPPQVLKSDVTNGLLIIEDLGNDIFARHMEEHPKDVETLYHAAVDVLLQLHKNAPPTGLLHYGPIEMSEVGCLALTWYARGCDHVVTDTQIYTFQAELESVLTKVWFGPTVLVQRDYHAENLLWLPERSGPKSVGLLDYQDGRTGHVAYDLASLLEDARRDVEPTIAAKMRAYYIAQSGLDAEQFDAAYAAMAAQRNLRILGVFARLSMHFSKSSYIDLIPRVWEYLMKDLEHPALKNLKDLCAVHLPYPTQENLEKLKAKCGTIPHL